jgi:hypothetical protein
MEVEFVSYYITKKFNLEASTSHLRLQSIYYHFIENFKYSIQCKFAKNNFASELPEYEYDIKTIKHWSFRE